MTTMTNIAASVKIPWVTDFKDVNGLPATWHKIIFQIFNPIFVLMLSKVEHAAIANEKFFWMDVHKNIFY